MKITVKELRKSMRNHLGGTCTVPRDINYRIRQAGKHKDFNPELIKHIRKQPAELVLSEATVEARLLYNQSKQVGYDAHRIRMYTRLKVSKKGILYARIKPEHNTEYDALDFFIERFPMFLILLESKRGVFYGSRKLGKGIMKTTLKEILPKLESTMEDNDILDDLEDFSDDLWKEFYSAQYVSSRRNLRLFYKNMPKKMQHAYTMDMEKHIFDGNRSLLEF